MTNKTIIETLKGYDLKKANNEIINDVRNLAFHTLKSLAFKQEILMGSADYVNTFWLQTISIREVAHKNGVAINKKLVNNNTIITLVDLNSLDETDELDTILPDSMTSEFLSVLDSYIRDLFRKTQVFNKEIQFAFAIDLAIQVLTIEDKLKEEF